MNLSRTNKSNMKIPSSSPSSLSTLVLFLLFLFSLFINSRSLLLQSLQRGASLSVEHGSHLLVSQDRSFSTGFYRVGDNAYCFAIWFANSANQTPVWMANRDQPVNGQGSRISLNKEGALLLTDIDGSIVWKSNTNSTNAVAAELLNTGNLVLKDPNGKILWESFDFPTDTLLPSQPMTKGKRLISSIGQGMYSSGYYSFYFDNDNVLRLIYDGPEISSLYWPDPEDSVFRNGRTNYNSTRFAILDDLGRFLSSDRFIFVASDSGLGIRRRLTVDYDGNLRLYSLNESTGSWGISWVALLQSCKVHGLCGINGICTYTPVPKCSCPPGYEMNDPMDWNKGCKPKFVHICNGSGFEFVELPETDFYGFDLNYREKISFEACKTICLEDCSCVAFGYRLTGTGVCYPKSALFNGYRSPSFPGSMYLKLPLSRISETPNLRALEINCPVDSNVYRKRGDGGKIKWLYFYWFIGSFGGIECLFIGLGWWYLFRKHGSPGSMEEGYRAISAQFKKFTFAELKKATKNFREELGKGSSGTVYKGTVDDNRLVAVKKLEDIVQGQAEFWAEVSTIGRINHMNLARMWGFCWESSHRLLVYEYMENGSLDKHLFSHNCILDWSKRFRIALGAAKGLAYLHHECLEWVLHCDVKPENILLDEQFEAKIADFGLSKLLRRDRTASNFSRIRGTKGYMAPEWVSNVPITMKVDVYSYGIVLLEIVNGSRVSNWVMDGEEGEVELRRFVMLAKERMGSGEEAWVDDFVDKRLGGNFNQKQAAHMVEIGISCVEEVTSRRPTMDAIVHALLACEDHQSSVIEFEG